MAKSNYSGYVKVKGSQVKGASEAYNRDYEGMKTAYETYKRKDEPSAKETGKQISQGSESAIKRVQNAGNESDNERQREKARADRAKKNQDAADGKSRLTTDDKRIN